MQSKLIISFEDLSEADFLAKTELINSSMATNSNFPSPWPSPLASPSSLMALFSGYQTAFNAALTKDAAKIVLRNTARTSLSTYLKKFAPYLEVVANGDLAKLMGTGYSLRQSSVPSGGTDPLPAPTDFGVIRGDISGVLIAHARRLKGAGSFLVQTTDGDPTVEANWKNYIICINCMKIEITGQTPGKTVSVRMRAIGSNGPGVWTAAGSLMVV